MFRQRPFPFSVLILAVLITFYSVGSEFSLYWFYPQFDFFLHILSGLWIALIILWLAVAFGQMSSLKDYRLKSFLIAFVSAVFLGVVWELIENTFQLSSVFSSNYSFDTSTDIFTDALGGSIAYIYFVQKKRNFNKPAEVINISSNRGEIKKTNQ
jgi:hypothetical protein